MLCTHLITCSLDYTVECLSHSYLDQGDILDGIAVQLTDENESEMWRSDDILLDLVLVLKLTELHSYAYTQRATITTNTVVLR